jgi:hypothetical protein
MNVSGNVSAILAHKKISTVWSIGPNVMVSDVVRSKQQSNAVDAKSDEIAQLVRNFIELQRRRIIHVAPLFRS